jgi:RNA-directed DNA polymerase
LAEEFEDRAFKSYFRFLQMVIKKNKIARTDVVIRQPNPKIRGWANYYCPVVSKEAFSRVDSDIFEAI